MPLLRRMRLSVVLLRSLEQSRFYSIPADYIYTQATRHRQQLPMRLKPSNSETPDLHPTTEDLVYFRLAAVRLPGTLHPH
jgi:hypothetical protein